MPPIVGAVVNMELRELTFPIKMDSNVRPVTMADADGSRIYRRSLTFLLETVFNELFPGAVLTVDHSVASGGYYCQISKRKPLSALELDTLEKNMRQVVEADLPFTRKEVPLSEAIEFFKSEGSEDKLRLLAHRQKNYLTLPISLHVNLAGYLKHYCFCRTLFGPHIPKSKRMKWLFVSQNGGITGPHKTTGVYLI